VGTFCTIRGEIPPRVVTSECRSRRSLVDFRSTIGEAIIDGAIIGEHTRATGFSGLLAATLLVINRDLTRARVVARSQSVNGKRPHCFPLQRAFHSVECVSI